MCMCNVYVHMYVCGAYVCMWCIRMYVLHVQMWYVMHVHVHVMCMCICGMWCMCGAYVCMWCIWACYTCMCDACERVHMSVCDACAYGRDAYGCECDATGGGRRGSKAYLRRRSNQAEMQQSRRSKAGGGKYFLVHWSIVLTNVLLNMVDTIDQSTDKYIGW